MSTATVFSQKAEVRVIKGKDAAQTEKATVEVEAGSKATLTKDAEPIVAIDEPLVRDVLELLELVKREKQQGDLRIDSTFIYVVAPNEDESVIALYTEGVNSKSEPIESLTLTFNPISLYENFRVYDLNGRLCKTERTRVNETTGSFRVHLHNAVNPGESGGVIGIAKIDENHESSSKAQEDKKDGPLSYVVINFSGPYQLQYYRFIVPKPIIFVGANRDVIATQARDNGFSVTLRCYTGPYGDGACIGAYLDPEEENTTLGDIPDEYLGIQSKWDKQDSEVFTREMTRVRSGQSFSDQNTPLTALLTCFGSVVNRDFDLYAKSKHFTQTPDGFRAKVEQAGYWANILDLLSTPRWPNNPGNGYVHPIYLCRRGSMICEYMQPVVYEDGQWYVANRKKHLGAVNKFEKSMLPEKEIKQAEAKGYLARWEVAGPYIQRGKKYKQPEETTELPDILAAE